MSEINQKETKKSGRGGVRAGAGRPKGSTDRVTVQGLLVAIEAKTGGQSYEELLVDDFLASRLKGDSQLTHKYHTLLSNKFVANLSEVIVENIGDDIDLKKQAFIDAIASLKINNKEEPTDATD